MNLKFIITVEVNLEYAIDLTNKMAGEMYCFDVTSGEIVSVEVGGNESQGICASKLDNR